MPHILISTPWAPQGLTTLSVHLGRVLASMGHMVTYHQWQQRPFVSTGMDEDARVRRCAWADLELCGVDMVVWPEIVEADQVADCKRRGIRTVWIPMWEYVGMKPVPPYDAIVCPTRCCHDLLRASRLRPVASRLWLCPWWCDFPVHAPRPTPSTPVFLHIVRGTPNDVRNTSAVFAAWREFKRSGGRGRLVVKSLHALDGFVRDTRAPDCTIHEGAWPVERVLALYRRADVFVYPSKREGIGLVLLEALSAGLPVITTDAPPMNEWVTDANGLRVHSDTRRPWQQITEAVVAPGALAAAMRRCTPERIDQWKRNTHGGLDERRETFTAVWHRLLCERESPSVSVTQQPPATPRAVFSPNAPKLHIVCTVDARSDGHVPTEELVRRAAAALGWPVRMSDRPDYEWPDVLLFTHAWQEPVPSCRPVTVQWWFDLLWRDPTRALEAQERWRPEVMRTMDIVLLKERAHLDACGRAGLNAAYLDQACWPPLHEVGAAPREPDVDVAFPGACYDEGGRLDVIRALARRHRVGVWSSDPRWHDLPVAVHPPVYGTGWSDIVARSAIVLGTNYRNDVDGYWSNRVWCALGAGGFFLTRRVPGLADVVIDGVHCVMFDTVADAMDKAAYYLEHPHQRRRIARQGQVHAWMNHTYAHRLRELEKML